MKIMICGSMSFSKEIVELQRQLENLGHDVAVPSDIQLHLDNPAFVDDLENDFEHIVTNDVMRQCFDLLADSEAVIFLNLPKNGVSGYMGTSSLMEAGLAYYLRKKIYLMYPHPNPREHRWAHEVASFQPTILNGDITSLGKA